MTYKPISWFALWKRLGKQPLSKTKGQYVKCCIVGQMWYCQLVYKHNGSDFYLVPIRLADKEQNNDSM